MSSDSFTNVIPQVVAATSTGQTFVLGPATMIAISPATPEMMRLGSYLAELLRPATGYQLPVVPASAAPAGGNITLTTASDADSTGYTLEITTASVQIVAAQPVGVFYGVQTLRQLLPPAIAHATLQDEPWLLPTGRVQDYPRFAWRGAMLDVARHFFAVAEVKRFIDLLAFYKMNRLHLHLSDDQGWRIMIESWPQLALHGGQSAIHGDPGGYYTQAEYRDLVAYAAERFIEIVPEIDLPGHTNAALAAYPELNCSGEAPPIYTGQEVGFSTLCVESEQTYTFINDVIGELAALTPGPFIHIGGDEALVLSRADYVPFIERVEQIVQAHGKRMIGWEEIAQAELDPTTVAQHWHNEHAQIAARQGSQIIMSPASKAYLDMKYDATTPLGLSWAGHIEVETGYSWDPVTELADIREDQVLGIEAPLWTETVQTRAEFDYLVFPRLLGYAEIGWSPREGRNWASYRPRLAAHSPHLTALGVQFYRSAQVPWPQDEVMSHQ